MSKVVMSLPEGMVKNCLIGGGISLLSYVLLQMLCALLVDRGVLRNENAVVSAVIPKDDVLRDESRAVIERTFDGSLPSFLAHFMGGRTISDAEADELKAVIDSFRE